MNSLLTPSNLNNHVGSFNLHHQSDILILEMCTKAGSKEHKDALHDY